MSVGGGTLLTTMFSEPLFIQVSTTPSYLLVVFCVFLCIMDLLLVRLLRLSDSAWKRVDYIWLGTAVLGLVASSTQGGRLIGSNYLKTMEPVLESKYTDLRATLRSGIDGMICRSFQRAPGSPDNLDTVIAEYDTLCRSYRMLFDKLPTELPKATPSLEELGFVLPHGDDIIVGPYINMLRSSAQSYENIRRDVVRWRGQSKQGGAEDAFLVLGPLAIAFALALRITKVTGELANARRRHFAT
jgi:hypothetical protein